MDKPIERVKEVIQELHHQGYESLIFTEVLVLMRKLKEMQENEE